MDRTVPRLEWKPEASTGKSSQVELALIGAINSPMLMDVTMLSRISFSGALNEAAKHSGLEDQEIADEIHISHGYMSRFMRGVGQQWAKRLVAFMNSTNSRAPLQWIAHQVGCDVVVRSAQSARIAALEAALAAERGRA